MRSTMKMKPSSSMMPTSPVRRYSPTNWLAVSSGRFQ